MLDIVFHFYLKTRIKMKIRMMEKNKVIGLKNKVE